MDTKVAQYKSIAIANEPFVRSKQRLEGQMDQIESEIRKIVMLPENVVPFLVPGRVIRVKTKQQEWGWGVLAGYAKQKLTAKSKEGLVTKGDSLVDIVSGSESQYILDVYLYSKDKLTSEGLLQPGNVKKQDGRLGAVPVILSDSTIHKISTIQLNIPSHSRELDNPKAIEAMYMELMKRFDFGDKFEELDPVEDMEIEFDPA